MMSVTAVRRKLLADKEMILCIAVFAVYSILTFIGALNHEIWFDEAQAWNIARDNDIAGIISQMVYEGHPPLWHFLLYPFSHSGVSVEVLPFISWFITCLTAALVLWKSPFGLPMKCIVIFSGGFLFHWSVTARQYCIVALIMVLIAIAYKSRNEHPIVFGILVGLLANTHIMMCGLVGIIGIYMIIDLIKLRKSSSIKMNIFRLAGLLAAGVGVILLILPLVGSIQANYPVSSRLDEITLSGVIDSLVRSLPNICGGIVLDSNNILYNQPLFVLLMNVLSVGFILMMIFLRHYRRQFIMQCFFVLFYIGIAEVMWKTKETLI